MGKTKWKSGHGYQVTFNDGRKIRFRCIAVDGVGNIRFENEEGDRFTFSSLGKYSTIKEENE
jgi:hypothetical protein